MRERERGREESTRFHNSSQLTGGHRDSELSAAEQTAFHHPAL